MSGRKSGALRVGAVVGAAVASTVLAAIPAQAASGGGCRDTGAIGACISYSNQAVYSDFYMNRPPDYSMCWAKMTIVKNGTPVKSQNYALTRTGRYGPISVGTATLPPSSGSAYTKVTVYTCSDAPHFTATSPTVYFP